MEVKDIARNEEIASLIASGVETQASALAMVRSAALQFAELIPRDYESNDVSSIVKHGRALYADEFNGDHNLSAYFGDVATLSMAGDMPISFVDRKKEEQHTTGTGAVGLSKHDLKSAAKAAREEMGIARAAGGGRTPRQTTKAVPAPIGGLVRQFQESGQGVERYTGRVPLRGYAHRKARSQEGRLIPRD